MSQEALNDWMSANRAYFPSKASQNPFSPFYAPISNCNPPINLALPQEWGELTKSEYEKNEIVQTIRILAPQCLSATWIGTLKELLEGGQANNLLIGATEEMISWEVWALEGFLRQFDNIYHYAWHENGETKHLFCWLFIDNEYNDIPWLGFVDFNTKRFDIGAACVDAINNEHCIEGNESAFCLGHDINCMTGHPGCPYRFSNNRCEILAYQGNAHFASLDKSEVELAFGIPIKLPAQYYPEIIKNLSANEKLILLKLLDRVYAARLHYDRLWHNNCISSGSAEESLVLDRLNSAQNDFDRVLDYFHSIHKKYLYLYKGNYDPNFREQQQNLILAYESDQYYERLLRGEPVLFHQGRLYFENFIFEHGYQPGVFPGLSYYKKDGEYVNPEEFSRWIEKMQNERIRLDKKRVGFWGGPVCAVNTSNIVRYAYEQSMYQVILGESYRIFQFWRTGHSWL